MNKPDTLALAVTPPVTPAVASTTPVMPAPADPEVAATAKRRQFSGSERRRILVAADRCTAPGEIGALLRREGTGDRHAWLQARFDQFTFGFLVVAAPAIAFMPDHQPLR